MFTGLKAFADTSEEARLLANLLYPHAQHPRGQYSQRACRVDVFELNPDPIDRSVVRWGIATWSVESLASF